MLNKRKIQIDSNVFSKSVFFNKNISMSNINIFISIKLALQTTFIMLIGILFSFATVNASDLNKDTYNIPELIISKTLSNGATLNTNGTYDLTFNFEIENAGGVTLTNLQVIDVLTAFAPVNNITFGTSTPNITLNNAFDGAADINLLAGTDIFAPAETGNFQLILNVGPGSSFTAINNQADANGTAPDGTIVSGSSSVPVNFPIPSPTIDITKTINNGPTLNTDGTYDITFDFEVENAGGVTLTNLQVIDVLTAFAPVNNITFGTSTPNITLNNAFDGAADINLLAGTDIFAPAETGNFQLILNVGPGSSFTAINNQADANGTAPDGTIVSGSSSVPVNFPIYEPIINIAKTISDGPTLNADATYNITFDFFLQNTGNVNLTNLQVNDLLTSFASINTINFVSNSPNISYNTAFDGLLDTNLLTGNDSLNPIETAQFQLSINIGPDNSFSNILNIADVTSNAPDGSATNSSSAVETVFPEVIESIDITKSISSGPTLNNDGTYDITFDFFVENTGNVNLLNLQVLDNLNAFAPINNISFGSSTPNFSLNSNFNGLTDVDVLTGSDILSPSETGSFQIKINIGLNNFTTLQNQAEAAGISPNGILTNNTSTVNVPFTAIVSDYEVSKTLFKNPVLNVDGTYDYSFRIEINNTGNVNLNSLQLIDNLAQFTPINSTNIFNFSSNITPNSSYNGVTDNNLLLNSSVLVPAENVVLFLDVNSGPYNPFQNITTNTVEAEILTLFGDTLKNVSAADAFFVASNPGVNIVKTLVNTPIANDDGTFDLFFKIDIENTGNIILNNIQVTDDFNNLSAVNSAIITNPSSNISPNGIYDGILNINALQGVDDFQPGESGSFIINANVGPYNGQQMFTNIAEITALTNANEQITDNDDEIVTIEEPVALMFIDKFTLNGPTLNNNGTYDIVYRIELTNTGEVTLTDIQVTDNLNNIAPVNQTVVTSASANISPNSNFNGITNNNTLTGFDFLLPGEVGKFDVTVNVGPFVTLPVNLNNVANVSSLSPNGTAVNNTDSEPINLPAANSSLSIDKTLLDGPTLNSDGTYDATYLIKITNTGSVNLNNVQIKDDLSSFLPLNTASITNTSASISSNGSYNGVTDVNTLIGNNVLVPDETATLNLNINFGPMPASIANVQNTAIASAENPNGVQILESANINSLLPAADSKLNTQKKLTSPPTLNTNGTYDIDFLISIENTGNVILTDLQITDDLSNYTPINAVTTNSASANISLNANFNGINDLSTLRGFDNLLPGESGNFSLSINAGPYAQIPAAGTLLNTIDASAIDPLDELITSTDSETTDLPTPNTDLTVIKNFNGNSTANNNGTYDLEFFIELNNSGNVTLSNLQLIDDLNNFSPINSAAINNPSSNININPLYDGLINTTILSGNDLLESGQNASLELIVNVGPYNSATNTNLFDNTASASALDPNNNIINSSNNIAVPLEPVISTIIIDKNLAATPSLLANGSYDIKYSFEINNTGTVNLNTIQVIDDLNAFSPVNSVVISNTSANISPNASYNGISDLDVLLGFDNLAPNELGSFEIMINVGPYSTNATPDFIVNESTVFGINPSNEIIKNADAVETYFSTLQASLNVQKTLLNNPTLNADGTVDLEFNIRLTNTGNVDLNNLQVADELNIFTPVNSTSVVNTSSNISPNSSYNGVSNLNTLLGNDNLMPAETAIFDIVVNVGPYSFTPTNIANQIEVTAKDPAGNEITEIATAPVVLPEQEPAITITKNNIGEPVLKNNGSFDLSYSIEVSNNGNANLSNIQIFDDLSGFAPVNNVNLSNTSANFSNNANFDGINNQSLLIANSTLIPGETGSVQLNLNVGPFSNATSNLTNSAVVNGIDPGANIIADTSTVNTILPIVNPAIIIDKTILDGPVLQSNGTYETVYLIKVTNVGNTDLADIQLSDNLNILAPLNAVAVSNVSANFTNNVTYDGLSDINLLTGSDLLSSTETAFLQITINSGPYGNSLYNTENTAIVTAKDLSGNDLQESSSAITSYEPPFPELGLSKALISSPELLPNGTFNILLRFFIENSGNVSINDLQITDDLLNTFSIAPTPNFNVVNIFNTSNNISGNTDFDGTSDINLLLGNDILIPGENGFVDLEVNFGPLPQNTSTTFYNTAVASGYDPSLVLLIDTSTNGLDPDPENDGSADNFEPTPISTAPPTGQVGIAKELITASSILADGTYDVVYKIILENTGPVIVSNVQIIDNLSAAFAGPPVVPINNVVLTGATNNLSLNPDFDGVSDNNLLTGTDSFQPGETASIRLEANVGIVPQPGGTYLNQAFISAIDSDGSIISDGSQNGNNIDPDDNGPLNNNEPTPLDLAPGLSSLNISKTIKTAPILNQNGTYDLSFNLLVENDGFVPLSDVQILDALTNFAPINNIILANSSSNLSPNSVYDGLFNVNLLTGSNTLLVGQSGSLDLFLNVGPFTNNVNQITNYAVATGIDENDVQIFKEDGATASFGEISSNLNINKFIVAGPTDNEDGTYDITFRISVTNNGNISLSNLQISDDLFDYSPINDINFKNISSNISPNGSYDGVNNILLLTGNSALVPGENSSIDLEVNVGPFSTSLPNLKNTATATAILPNGQESIASDFIDTPIDFLEPLVSVTKTLATDPILNKDGTYNFNFLVQVSNAGVIQLNDLQIVDNLNNFAPINNLAVSNASSNLTLNLAYDGINKTNILLGNNVLLSNQSGTFNIELNAGPFGNNPDSLLNIIFANATSSNDIAVEDADTAIANLEIYQPELLVQKRLFGGPVINNNGTYSINYLVSVENRGNTVIDNVQLIDDLSNFAPIVSTSVALPSFTLFANSNYNGITDPNLLLPNNSLEPGEIGILNLNIVVGPYTTTPENLENIVTASGLDPISTILTSEASASTPFNISDPELAISKTLIDRPLLQNDGSYTFSYLINVGNIGPVEISNLQVQDDLTSFAPVNSVLLSSPTANLSLNPSYDGLFNINTLAGIDVLGSSQIGAFKLTINAGPFNNNNIDIVNTAIVSGEDPSNKKLFKSTQESTSFEIFDAAINVDKLLVKPPTLNDDGTYDQMFFINLANTGAVAVSSLQLIEDLTQYGPLNEVNIISPSANLSPNPIFDGITSKNLLTGLDALMPGEQASVAIAFNAGPYNPPPVSITNTIIAQAFDPLGINVEDIASAESTYKAEAPKIFISKSLDTPPLQFADGTFDLLFNIDVQNIGNVEVENIQMIDDLSNYLPLNNAQIVNATPNLSQNFAYNGLSNTNMLFGSDKFLPGEIGKIQLFINVGPYDNLDKNLNNVVNVFALSPNGTIVTERSSIETPIEPPKSEILLAKRLNELPKLQGDGSYNISYNFVLQNTGNTALNEVKVIDDLLAFQPVNSAQVLFTSANISPNSNYNGIADINLLSGLNNLLPGELASFNLQLNIGPHNNNIDTLFNSATILATSPSGQIVQDFSGFTLGTSDTENLPTPTPLAIPDPNLSITKNLVGKPVVNNNGSFTTTYAIIIKNTGNVVLNNVQLQDDLSAFTPINNIVINYFSTNLTVNNSFNGFENVNLLSGNNSLQANETARLEITINAGPYPNTLAIENQVFGQATSLQNITVQDASDGVFNNNTFDDPTPATFTKFTEVDLTIDKQAITPKIAENETGEFLITVTNNSLINTAHNIIVNEILPNKLDYTGHFTNNGVYNQFDSQWLIDSLAPQESADLTIQVESDFIGTYINNCIISAVDEKETNIFNNESQATITIGEPTIDLEINKIVIEDTVSFGTAASFEILINNIGNSLATGIVIEEILPSGSSVINYSSSAGSYNNYTNKWFLDALAPQNIDTLYLSLVLNESGNFTNTATILETDQPDEFEGNNTSSAIIYVTKPIADLSIEKTVSVDTILQNEMIDFNIVLTNNSNLDVNNVTVEELLPTSFNYQNHNVSSGNFNALTNLWFLNSVRSGRSETLTLSIEANNAGSFTNTVNIIETEPADTLTFNNSAMANVTVLEIPALVADLSINKTVQNDSIDLGQTVAFDIEVTNNSDIPATDIIIEELLPPSFNYISHQLSKGDFYSLSNNWEIGNLPAAATETLTITVLPNQVGTFTNSVYISQAEPLDTIVDNNSSSADVTIEELIVLTPTVDLSINKTVQNYTIDLGETVAFDIEITNNSDIPASDIIIEELLPPSFNYISHQLSKGDFYSLSNNWEIESLPAAATETLTITVLPNQVGTFTNSVFISQAEPMDTIVDNNSSSANVTIEELIVLTPTVDLSINKTVQNDTINLGQTVAFDIEITNNSDITATDIIIEELLPPSFNYISHQLSKGDFYSLSNNWEIGNLPAAATETLTINVLPNQVGTFTNSVFISQAEPMDTIVDNNSSSANVTIEELIVLTPTVDLSINKTVQNDTINLGQTVAFDIEITNNSDITATDIIIEELLPPSFNYISHQLSKGDFYSLSNNWEIGNLPAAATETLTINVLPNQVGTFTNSVFISQAEPLDTIVDNNSSSADVTIEELIVLTPTVDLSINKTVQNDTIDLGQTVAFDIEVTNNSNIPASDIIIEELLPPSFNYISHQLSKGDFYSLSNNWEIGNLPAAATETLTITVLPNQVGTFTNSVFISQAEPLDTIASNNSSSAGLTIKKVIIVETPIADLSINKTVQNDTIDLGQTVAFNIEVTNNSNIPASNIIIKELLPSSFTYVDHQVSRGEFNTQSNNWEIESLPAAATETLTITVLPNQVGTFTNSVFISQAEPLDTIVDNNSSSADVTIEELIVLTPTVDLSINKTVQNDTIDLGQTVAFDIEVTNNSDITASDIIIEELLPPSFNYISHQLSKGDFYSLSNNWEIGNLPAAATETLTINVLPNQVGTFTNSVYISQAEPLDTIASNNSSSADVTIKEVVIVETPIADLSINKTVQNDTIDLGQTVAFDIEVTNNSDIPASDIIIKELLPSSFTYVDHQVSRGDFNTQSNNWEIESLPAAATETLTITVLPNQVGTFTNSVYISQAEPLDTIVDNNSSSADVTIEELIVLTPTVDLSINKTVQNDTIDLGQTVAFDIEVTNNSNIPASDIVVEELLPETLSYQTHNATIGSFNIMSNLWELETLAANETATLSLTVLANQAGKIINVANINKSEPADTITANNSSSTTLVVKDEEIVIIPTADLSINKTVLNDNIEIGETTTFSIEVTNNSDTTATNIVVEELLPQVLRYRTHSASTGSFNAINNLWNINALASGQRATLSLTILANEAGSFINTVNIIQSEPIDIITINNSSSTTLIVEEEEIVIIPTADLSINKTVVNNSVFSGQIATFNIEIINNSNTIATDIVVEELLPETLSYQTHTSTNGSFNTMSNLWEIETLAANQTASLSLTVLTNLAGEIINVANITKSEPIDTITANNSSSAILIVEEEEIVIIPTADLSINKTVVNNSVFSGQIATFNIEIINNGNTTATNIVVEELLPETLSYQTHNATKGSFNAINNMWSLDALAANEKAKLSLSVLANGVGSFTNTVNIIQAKPLDVELANNSSSVAITVEEIVVIRPTVDIAITKTALEEVLNLGEAVTFNIEVKNISNTTATNIVIEELLPPSLIYQIHNASIGRFNALTNMWIIDALLANQTASLTLNVITTQVGDFTNRANIVSVNESEVNVSNNSSTALISVIEIVDPEPAEIDLRVNKSVSNEVLEIGEEAIFSTIIENINSNAAHNVTIEELLPNGLTYVRHTDSEGSFDPNSKLWNIPLMNGQTSAKLDIVVQANALGTLVNVVNIISSTEVDNNLFNNRASASVFVNESTLFADLSLTKSANKPIADVGETVEFNIILSNYGPNDATNIVVEEILPNTINYLSHSPTSGSFNISNGQWVIDNLPANSAVALSVQTNSFINGEHSNTVKIISSDALDNNINNNTASASFTVLSTLIDPCLSPTICPTINKCIAPGAELLICPEFCETGNLNISTYSSLTNENNVIISNNCIIYQASNSINNTTDIIRIEAKDENDICLNFNVNIEIKDCNQINRAPIIANASEAYCGAPVRSTTICIDASDSNNDDIDICEISTIFDCSIGNANNMCFTYKPLPGSNGMDEVTVTVCDNGNPSLSSTATYFVNVACVTPTLNHDYLLVNNNEIKFNENTFNYNNGVALINPLLNDTVSAGCYNKLELTSVSTIANATGEVMLIDNEIQFKPNPSFTGNDVINYRACNNCGRCETGNIYIQGEMQNCNLFSEICSPAFVAMEICVEFCSSTTAIESISSMYNATTTTINEQCFTYNVNNSTGITDTLKITGTDTSGNIETVQILNYVNDACLKPIAVDDALSTTEQKSILFDVVANDDPLTINYELKIIKQTLNGDCEKNLNGSILYKPNYGFTGLDVLTYELCNAHNNCDTANVYLNVEDDNMPNLIAFNDYFITNENEAIIIDVVANDTLATNVNTALTITAKPLFGSATIVNGNITYSPIQNFVGEDFFEYQLCNEYNECDKAIVQVNVKAAFITSTEEFTIPQAFEILQIMNNSNNISLQINATENKIVAYNLFDMMGKSLQSGSLNLNIGNNIISLEKPTASTQVLLFSLKSDAHFMSKKVYVH